MSSFITYFEIAAFISCLLAWPVIRKSSYLRLFPLLLFVIVSVEIYMTYFRPRGPYVNALIYNLQVPVQHVLYLSILFLALERKTFKRFIGFGIIGFILLVPVTIVFFTEPNKINTLAYCAGCSLIIIGILMKFYEMLQNPTDFNFLRNPFFYILFAFLLFNVGTLPYFAMGNWLYYTLKREDILMILVNVMSVFNYILYTTYTIAFLWMTLKIESSSYSQR